MGCAPQPVLTAHPSDQIADLAGNGGPTHLAMPDLPGPEKAKSLAMPGDRRRRFDDVQRRAPVPPDPGEENPKQAVGHSQLRPFPGGALKDPDLVPESEVLQLQRSAGSGTSNTAWKGERTSGSASDKCHFLKENGVSDSRFFALFGCVTLFQL